MLIQGKSVVQELMGTTHNVFNSSVPNIVIYTFFLIFGIFCNDYGFSNLNFILIGLFLITISFLFLKYILKKHSEFYGFFVLSLMFFFIGSLRNQQVWSYYNNKINLLNFCKLDIEAKVLDINIYDKKRMPVCLSLEIQNLIEKNIYTKDPLENIDKKFSNYKHELFNVYTKHNPKFKIGDIIKLKNIEFKKIENKEFKRYLIKEEILSNLFIAKLNSELIKKDLNLYNKIAVFKNNLIKKIETKLSKIGFSYFALIFLGNKNINEPVFINIKKDFSYWGLSHYIARAGLHLLMVILILQILIAYVPLNFMAKKILSISLIAIYSILSWSSIGFLRSLIMFLFYNICNFLDLPIQAINIVAITCLLVLIHNPQHLFFLDFQLSFGITFALAVYSLIKSNY